MIHFKKQYIFVFLFIILLNSVFSQPAVEYYNNGINKYFELKDYHGAIKEFNKAIELNPDFGKAIHNRGIAKVNLGNIDDACNDLNSVYSFGLNKLKKTIAFICDNQGTTSFIKNRMIYKKGAFAENNFQPIYTLADTLRGALRFERNCFDVTYYDLNIRIIPKEKKITGKNDIYFKTLQTTKVIQIDLFDQYIIDSITWNGLHLNFVRQHNALFISFPEIIPEGSQQMISITYSGIPQKAEVPLRKEGFIWGKDKYFKGGVSVTCEQSGASLWWPNKDHPIDKADSIRINLEVPTKYKGVAKGALKSITEIGDGYTRYEWLVNYPISNNLVTFYMGKFVSITDTFENNSGIHLINHYLLPQYARNIKTYSRQISEILTFYEEVFGEYPFWDNGFTMVSSPYLDIQDQSSTTYNDIYRQEYHDYTRDSIYDEIVVYKAANEWWGNVVSVGDMADAWMHKGFSTYATLLFIERKFGYDAYRNEIFKKMKTIFNIFPIVGNRNVNDNALANDDIYQKGAIVLHNLRCIINNDSLFIEILKSFLNENKFGIVSSNDFVEHVNKLAKQDITDFFDIFLNTTELPLLKYKFIVEESNIVLTFKWDNVKPGFEMPFGILTNDSSSMRINATTAYQTITIENAEYFIFSNPWSRSEKIARNSLTYYKTSWMEE